MGPEVRALLDNLAREVQPGAGVVEGTSDVGTAIPLITGHHDLTVDRRPDGHTMTAEDVGAEVEV